MILAEVGRITQIHYETPKSNELNTKEQSQVHTKPLTYFASS